MSINMAILELGYFYYLIAVHFILLSCDCPVYVYSLPELNKNNSENLIATPSDPLIHTNDKQRKELYLSYGYRCNRPTLFTVCPH